MSMAPASSCTPVANMLLVRGGATFWSLLTGDRVTTTLLTGDRVTTTLIQYLFAMIL